MSREQVYSLLIISRSVHFTLLLVLVKHLFFLLSEEKTLSESLPLGKDHMFSVLRRWERTEAKFVVVDASVHLCSL